MDKKKYYKYAGNPSCGCCDNMCPSIQIDRCNFNEFCETSGEEWIEYDYGTARRPDKRCELWYSQRATITIKSDKIEPYDSALIVSNDAYDEFGDQYYRIDSFPGFHATPWDTKPSVGEARSQTRADGDMFIETTTVRYGSHTVVCTITTEWIYNEDSDDYDIVRNALIYIDNIPCWCGDGESVWSNPSPNCSFILYRNEDNVDVYTTSWSWVGSFPYSESHFTYEYNAEYYGTQKYLCVNPKLNWYTVKNKPECVWYPPETTLTQEQIGEIEERQRIESNSNCKTVNKAFCPACSPPFEFRISNVPSVFSSCINKFRPAVWNDYWLQETSYYIDYIDYWNTGEADTLVARRLKVLRDIVIVVAGTNYYRPYSICKKIPYGYTVEFYLDPYRPIATDRTVSIATAPKYGTAEIFVDRNDDGYIIRQGFRYTAPTSLPTGACTDLLEYEVVGFFGEIFHREVKLVFYKADETQSEAITVDLETPENSSANSGGYAQEVWKLIVYGETINEYSQEIDTNWQIDLYGLLPVGAKTYKDVDGVTFRYYEGLSTWYYTCRDEDGDHSFSHSGNAYSWEETLYQRVKAQMEAVTATISLDVDDRGAWFITNNNNVLESCSTKPIKTTTTTVKPKLVKTEIYTVWTDDGAETTETVKKTVQLPEHTVVFDWGISPAESPYGPYVPNQDESFRIDFSEYAADFNVDSFWNTYYYMRVYIAPGGIKCDPDTPYQIYYGGIDSGRTQNDEPWSLDEKITFEVESTTEITYFE